MLLLAAVIFSFAIHANAAEYQWSVPFGNKPSGRAFLWIPPSCKHVRGLIIGSQVILEKTALDDPKIRAVAERQGLGIVICIDTPVGVFADVPGADKALIGILNALANESGYSEVATAPLLPIGHSGSGIFVWNVCYWNPSRVIAGATLHSAAILPPAWAAKSTANGIPMLAVSGEYESWGHPDEPLDKHWRWLRGGLLNMRACYDESLVSEIVQPGSSHFSWDPSLADEVAQFIETAAKMRLPSDSSATTQPVQLNHVPLHSGWLTDITMMTPSRCEPAPYDQFKGDPTLAMWHLDEALARSAENYGQQHKGKLDQRVTFVVDGKPVPAVWIEEVPFQPIGDGMTMKMSATFLDKTPQGVAGAGVPLGHASGPIKFRLIGGWGGGGEQISEDTFRIRFDHFGINGRTNNIQIMAYQDGDAQYKYAEQPCQIKFPEKNKAGTAQQISFDKIADVAEGTAEIPLNATASSGLPVEFFVRNGPAQVRGKALKLSPIPPASKFPVKVTVVAYQWGRSIDPLVQSAQPVEQTFAINKH